MLRTHIDMETYQETIKNNPVEGVTFKPKTTKM